jgi:hypothetical protein
MSIEPVPADINDVGYIQREIAAAEQRIQAELERIAGLAEFQDLTVFIDVRTKRRLNARETLERVEVRIRAVI